MRSKSAPTLLLIAACAISTGAMAHVGVETGNQRSFFTGLTHPLLGMDHLAAMVAVGVWSALSARRAGPDLLSGPVGFAAMLMAGALLGLQGVQIPAVEPMIAASLLVTGLLVVSRLRVHGIAATLLVGAFAIFHGLAHGYELAGSASAVQTLLGMLSATVLLHACGLGLGWTLRSANTWIPRAAGACVAISGVTLLARLA